MPTTPLPPFTPHHVRLVGHRDLGVVPARFDGPWLEIDHPEHGGRYGPAAVFRAVPVVELVAQAKASRGALVWRKLGGIWGLCRPNPDLPEGAVYSASGPDSSELAAGVRQITTWAREDGYEVPPWPGEPAAPVEPQPEPVPAPVGTWGGHTDWIAWGGGECPVEAGALVGLAFRDGGTGNYHRTDAMRWRHTNGGGDIIAYRIVQPAPKDRTVYDPSDIRQGDRHTFENGSRGRVLCVHDGWIAYVDRLPVVHSGARIVSVDPFDPDDIPF